MSVFALRFPAPECFCAAVPGGRTSLQLGQIHERVFAEAARGSTRRNARAQVTFQLGEAAQKVRIEVLRISNARIESRTPFRAFDGVVNHAR